MVSITFLAKFTYHKTSFAVYTVSTWCRNIIWKISWGCTALFHYEKKLTINISYATLACLMISTRYVHACDWGYPVASVECCKKMLVYVNKPFIVGDYDFTSSSLNPSVALFIEIYEDINGSF